MADINELDLSDEVIVQEQTNYDELPDEYTPRTPPLYPSTYRFRLPPDLSQVWDAREYEGIGQRVTAQLYGDNALVVTQSKDGEREQDPCNVFISNRERPRGRKGEQINVSDMDYLLRALQHNGRPRTNKEYVEALSSHAGEEFVADVEWNAYCNPKKDMYVENEEGTGVEKAEGNTGCGTSYYQNEIPKVDGVYQSRFGCENCGAVLFVREQLRNFKVAKKD